MYRRLSVILLMLFVVFVGFGLIIPVLPLMIQNTGAKAYHVGFMLAAYSAVAFVMSPWWGRLSDRVGRKPVLVVGLAGFAVSFVIFGLASHLLWLMYVSRLIGGGFSGAVTSTAMAYIADITGEEDRTKGMALAGMSIGMGFIFGPGIGGLLSTLGLAVPFYAAGGLALLNSLWGLIGLQESLPPERRRPLDTPRQSRWAAFEGPLKYLYIVDFISQFCISTLEGCFQLYQSSKIGATSTDIGWMFLVSGIAGALVQGGIVRRIKPGNEVKAMYIGLVISAAGLSLTLLSTNFWTATLYMTIFGASNTVIKPTLQSVVTKETKVGQGVASGLISSMDSLGRIIGPVLATSLYEIRRGLPFIAAGLIALLGVLLVMLYQRSRKHERIVTATS